VVEEVFQYPDRLKRVATATVDGKPESFIFVVNGDKLWVKRPDNTVRELPNDAPKRHIHMFGSYCDMAACMEEGMKLAVVGEARVEGRQTVVVRANKENFGQCDLYFDQASALLVKSRVHPTEARGEKRVTIEALLSDFKTVQGGKIPM